VYEISAKTGRAEKYRICGGVVEKYIGEEEHPQAFPAIAAWVTSYGRELIETARKCAGETNTYYVVTDALFVNDLGKQRLQDAGWLADGVMGKFSVKRTASDGEFVAIHHYRVGSHGISGSRKSSAIELAPGVTQELRFEGLKSVLKRPFDSTIEIQPIVKHYKRSYNRGVIKSDGWVTPLEASVDGMGNTEIAGFLVPSPS